MIRNRSVATHRGQVNSIEQPVQLLHREFDHRRVLAWPNEARILQTLLQQPEAVAAPAQNLDAVLPAVAKDIDGVSKRIEVQLVFDQRRQTVDALAKVDGPAVQVHRQVGVQMKHGSAARVRSTLQGASALRCS